MGIIDTARRRTRRRRVEHAPGAPLVSVHDLSVRFNGHQALDRISFHLEDGERVAVVGPNGAGKSTLFRVISGVLEPTAGEVLVGGHCPGGHVCIAYLPQRSEVDWQFPLTVEDVVMMGRVAQLGWLSRPGRRDREMVHQCLEAVGLTAQAGRHIAELSGGQQQRMFIARSLAQEAELILMDEPLAGLDVAAQESILDVLDDLRGRHVTVMVATHDLSLAAGRFDRVMLLNTRLLGIGKPEEVLTTDLLRQGYGSQLRLLDSEDGVLVLSDTCCGSGGH